MLVHLQRYHRKVKKFKHPLLDEAVSVTKEQAAQLVAEYFANRSVINRDGLTMAMLPMLRKLVGRYLFNWPITRRYKDEMVSEGLLSIVKTVNGLTPETLAGRSVLVVVASRAQKAIEMMLYGIDNVASPSKRTQETYAASGEEVECLRVESDLTDVDLPDVSTQNEQDLLDAEDAIGIMAKRLQLDADLLKPEYRNLTIEEAAAKLGVHHTTISRRRAKLRSIYHVEFGG